MIAGIYAIVHRDTGRVYIGSAVNVAQRLKKHRNMLGAGTHKNAHLQSAWDKYGTEAFACSTLLWCDRELLLFFEQRAIDAAVNRSGADSLFNKCLVAGSRLGIRMSPENRTALSGRMRGNKYSVGRILSSEHREKIAAGNRGKSRPGRVFSEEERARISARMKGRKRVGGWKLSPETRARISAAVKRRTVSEESKRRLSQSLRGRVVSPETRAKISASLKGRPRGGGKAIDLVAKLRGAVAA